jgi:Lsr2
MQRVFLYDDIDHDQPADETVPFAVDGEAYAIDLSAENAEAFRRAVAPYRDAARSLGKHKIAEVPARRARPPVAKKAQPKKVPSDWYKPLPDDVAEVKTKKREYSQRVRSWAAQHLQYPAKRGVIPREVYEAYGEWAAENDVPTGPASVGL